MSDIVKNVCLNTGFRAKTTKRKIPKKLMLKEDYELLFIIAKGTHFYVALHFYCSLLSNIIQ